ncbi:MAG: DUF4340 domain-containing protein [Lewinella sp.]|nr:DUF4340 domain-containing protein [Lewinella sp.]
MNNKTLSIIFLVLLALYALPRLFSGNPDRSFRSELVVVDTSLVDQIELYPKTADGQKVTLRRDNGQWTVTNGSIETQAMANSVQSILGQLRMIQAKRVVARQPEKWKDYEVEDENAVHVKAYNDGNELVDLIVGRFNFNQQTRQAQSYVRLAGEDEVYSVDGFLSMTFGQDFNAFRNKQILKLSGADQVTGLQWQGNGTTALFQKNDGNWIFNGQPVDSTAIAGYVDGLNFVSGSTFADGFNPAGSPEQSLQIQTPTGPIAINAFRYTGGDKDFVIQSSQFPGALFSSDSTGVYDRLFGKLQMLVADQ